MKRVHCSVPVDPQESKLFQARDRIHSRRDMCQEGVEATAGPLLRRQVTPILANRPKTACKYICQGIWEPSGPQHLSHQSRRPKGVGGDHGGLTGESLTVGGINGLHAADSWVGPDFASRVV